MDANTVSPTTASAAGVQPEGTTARTSLPPPPPCVSSSMESRASMVHNSSGENKAKQGPPSPSTLSASSPATPTDARLPPTARPLTAFFPSDCVLCADPEEEVRAAARILMQLYQADKALAPGHRRKIITLRVAPLELSRLAQQAPRPAQPAKARAKAPAKRKQPSPAKGDGLKAAEEEEPEPEPVAYSRAGRLLKKARKM